MSTKHRSQILLEPEQHQTLAKMADERGSSISEIVRTAVDQWLAEQSETDERRKRIHDMELIKQHRVAILERRDGLWLDFDVAELVTQVRQERADDIINSITDPGD